MRMPPTGCAWCLVDDVADVAAEEKAETVGHTRRPAVANSNARAVAMRGMVGGEQYTYYCSMAPHGGSGEEALKRNAGMADICDQSTSYSS